MKKINSFLLAIVLMSGFLLPVFANAAPSPETQAGKTGITYECVDSNGKYGECTFQDLIAATVKLVNWAIEFSIALSVIVIAYAGYMYMTSGANSGQRTKANQMLIKVVTGIGIMMAAWLIVHLIASVLITNPNVTEIIKN